jgi:hypothetical protein
MSQLHIPDAVTVKDKVFLTAGIMPPDNEIGLP